MVREAQQHSATVSLSTVKAHIAKLAISLLAVGYFIVWLQLSLTVYGMSFYLAYMYVVFI